MSVVRPLVLVDRAVPRPRAAPPTLRGRSITLHFVQNAGESGPDITVYNVFAGGEFFDGRGSKFQGRLSFSRRDLEAAAARLREVWVDDFLMYEYSDHEVVEPKCFSRNLDLTTDRWNAPLERAFRAMAVGGRQLFNLIFVSFADAGLKRIGVELREAFRTPGRRVTIATDGLLYIPWRLLYLHEGTDLSPRDLTFFEGFLGYRHLIEQTVKFNPYEKWKPELRFDGVIEAGVNVDGRLDYEFTESPVVEPVVRFLSSRTMTRVRYFRELFIRDIRSPDFSEQLMYFACHGTVAGKFGAVPRIALSDNEPITHADVKEWFGDERLIATSPMVFVNACEGARLSSTFYSSFGSALLEGGANCLVGPDIEIPPAFAVDYALRFLERVLTAGVMVGDVVRELAEFYLQKYRNPLGLMYTLFRGLDTHFWPNDEIGGDGDA